MKVSNISRCFSNGLFGKYEENEAVSTCCDTKVTKKSLSQLRLRRKSDQRQIN